MARASPLSAFQIRGCTPGYPRKSEKCPATPFPQRRRPHAIRYAGIRTSNNNSTPALRRRRGTLQRVTASLYTDRSTGDTVSSARILGKRNAVVRSCPASSAASTRPLASCAALWSGDGSTRTQPRALSVRRVGSTTAPVAFATSSRASRARFRCTLRCAPPDARSPGAYAIMARSSGDSAGYHWSAAGLTSRRPTFTVAARRHADFP